jgi:hypothetical protein
VALMGYESGQEFEDDIEYADELNPGVLDSIHLAGSRFDKLLKHIMES